MDRKMCRLRRAVDRAKGWIRFYSCTTDWHQVLGARPEAAQSDLCSFPGYGPKTDPFRLDGHGVT